MTKEIVTFHHGQAEPDILNKSLISSKAVFISDTSGQSFLGTFNTGFPIALGFQTELRDCVWEAVNIGKNMDGQSVVDFRSFKGSVSKDAYVSFREKLVDFLRVLMGCRT